MENQIVDSVEALMAKIDEVRKAQEIFATYSQEQVDKIFTAAALAANNARLPLAKMAVAETGMGIVEDKVIKNHYAAEYIYNAYKDVKTCGVVEEDAAYGVKKIAEPIGVVAAVIPTTNPTSTAIFKTLICLKTQQRLIIAPIRARRTAPLRRRKSCWTPPSRRARPRHRGLDRRSLAGNDQHADEDGGYHSGDGRPRHGQKRLFFGQTRPRRGRGQYPRPSSTTRRT